MLRILAALRSDELGFVVSSELALVSTLGVLGMTAGLSQVSGDVHGELLDVGAAYRSMDQSFAVTTTNGTVIQFVDHPQGR
jgi:hypothetical protein